MCSAVLCQTNGFGLLFHAAIHALRSAASTAIDESVPAELAVHAVLDNSSTHKTPAIRDWLLKHPRFTFHFTPTSSSWMNLVERWFAELTNKMLKRSAHRSIAALTADLNAWIAAWNDHPKPFVWHKTADQILDNLKKYLTNL